jgi:hypothetical protein
MKLLKKTVRKKPAPTVPIEEIPVEYLVFDDRNPRFATPSGQADLYAKFADSAKTQRLARHVVNNGIDPLSALGVNKIGPKKYSVREGNRRTAALRLLHDPRLAGTDRLTKRFQDIVDEGAYLPPKTVRCAVFANPKDAHEWMRVKHAGAQDGVGTENWSPLQTSRFNTRTGGGHQYAFAQQLVDEAIDLGIITEDAAGDVAMSSLARVVNDSAVRKAFHVTDTPDGPTFGVGNAGREKLTRRLITDWSRGGKTVRDIDSADQRKVYAAGIVDELELKPVAGGGGRGRGLGSVAAEATPGGGATKSRSSKPRKSLIPSKFAFDDRKAVPRIGKIVKELRGLDIDKYTNAVSMLFRLFVEASIDQYNDRKGIALPPGRDGFGPKLGVRLEAALEHVRVNNPKEKQALKNVKAALGERNGLFALATLHEYVHNPTWQPVPDNLRTHWDNYSDFLRLLWE